MVYTQHKINQRKNAFFKWAGVPRVSARCIYIVNNLNSIVNIFQSFSFQGREYHTFHDIYMALSERHVIGALIDTYSAGSSKEEFENEHLRVNKILDFSSTYGIVMSKEARKLRRCFKDYTEKGFAIEIAHHIQRNTVQLKVKTVKYMGCLLKRHIGRISLIN